MKQFFLGLVLLLGATAATPSKAVSVCYNNVCGRIVCQSGCIQRAENGVCVVNTCTGAFHTSDSSSSSEGQASTEQGTLARCVSCAGGCCGAGNNFSNAERACKARCGDFGCFTRCN